MLMVDQKAWIAMEQPWITAFPLLPYNERALAGGKLNSVQPSLTCLGLGVIPLHDHDNITWEHGWGHLKVSIYLLP